MRGRATLFVLRRTPIPVHRELRDPVPVASVAPGCRSGKIRLQRESGVEFGAEVGREIGEPSDVGSRFAEFDRVEPSRQ